MALGLLWLFLTLLLALKTQAHNSTDEVILRPLLSKAPLQPDFQYDKAAHFWALLPRGLHQGYKGLQNFTVKVVETDYNQYAVVFYEAIVGNKLYMECLLYGRKKLSSDVMRNFFTLAKSLGFRHEYIDFTIPVGAPCLYAVFPHRFSPRCHLVDPPARVSVRELEDTSYSKKVAQTTCGWMHFEARAGEKTQMTGSVSDLHGPSAHTGSISCPPEEFQPLKGEGQRQGLERTDESSTTTPWKHF
ncbi:Neutrophil gelatinase-associated lipocalin [Fukomys damarensis]|uniref:Neutrophil gelatinase-associated lipocalin n=1 Tax=Fukomys damarensis TaxID=885580 RepID=A0A091DGC8_FUKDA|nr:Neutrophil gelatinase-associated lipocalin [Fukomys damarensis]